MSQSAALTPQRVAATVAVLLIAAAALLVAGILLEGHAESAQHSVEAATTEQHEGHHDESAEGSHSESPPDTRDSETEVGEHRTGIGVESPWIVALGTFAAIALAVAVWRRPSRPVLVIVAGFTAAALVLDVREITHQIAEGRTGLVMLAAVIVAIRIATIAGCGYLFRPSPVAA